MNATLQSLIRAVEEADSSAKMLEAVQNLAAARLEAAVPTLIAVLGYNNPGAAVAAVDGLVQIGEPAVTPLLEQLDRHNYSARAWAIRALAGIGDPRGLITLLGAATADFALSVRRAAARGLGSMKWHWFPNEELLEIAQEEALEALLFVAQQDEEWVVRYAAVVGLQSLAQAISATHLDWLSQIQSLFEQMANSDNNWAVRGRVFWAQQQLQAKVQELQPADDQPSPLSAMDWHLIMEKLYERRNQERLVFPEGDPRRYRELAVAMAEDNNHS